MFVYEYILLCMHIATTHTVCLVNPCGPGILKAWHEIFYCAKLLDNYCKTLWYRTSARIWVISHEAQQMHGSHCYKFCMPSKEVNVNIDLNVESPLWVVVSRLQGHKLKVPSIPAHHQRQHNYCHHIHWKDAAKEHDILWFSISCSTLASTLAFRTQTQFVPLLCLAEAHFGWGLPLFKSWGSLLIM